MDPMSQREEGFERAFSHQEELRFRARARRNRKLGEWAGAELGLSAAALADYAAAFVQTGVEAASDDALVRTLARQLPDVSEHRIRRRLGEFEAQAMAEIQTGR